MASKRHAKCCLLRSIYSALFFYYLRDFVFHRLHGCRVHVTIATVWV